jgi:hypothetical protein
MTERLEQRYCIKFCQKLGDSQVETIVTFSIGVKQPEIAAYYW